MLSKVVQIIHGRFKEGAFLHSALYTLAGNTLSAVVALVTGIIAASWVLPEDMGLWNLLQVVPIYLSVLKLGVFEGLSRELPLSMGKGYANEAMAYVQACMSWWRMTSLLVGLITLVAFVWFGQNQQQKMAWASLTAGGILVLTNLRGLLVTTYKSNQEFVVLAKISTASALAGLPLLVVIWMFGFEGFLGRNFLLALLATLLLLWRKPFAVNAYWNTDRLVHLSKVGIPIYVVTQLSPIFDSVDRLVLASAPSTSLLGYYTPALQAGTAARMVMAALASIIYPRMALDYGARSDLKGLWLMGLKATIITLLGGSIVGIFGWFTVPTVVRILLPNYIPGIQAAQWMSLIGIAGGPLVILSLFNVIKRQDLYILSWIIGVAGFFLFWGYYSEVPSDGSNLTVVCAQAMLFGTFCHSVTALGFARWVCMRGIRKRRCQ